MTLAQINAALDPRDLSVSRGSNGKLYGYRILRNAHTVPGHDRAYDAYAKIKNARFETEAEAATYFGLIPLV